MNYKPAWCIKTDHPLNSVLRWLCTSLLNGCGILVNAPEIVVDRQNNMICLCNYLITMISGMPNTLFPFPDNRSENYFSLRVAATKDYMFFCEDISGFSDNFIKNKLDKYTCHGTKSVDVLFSDDNFRIDYCRKVLAKSGLYLTLSEAELAASMPCNKLTFRFGDPFNIVEVKGHTEIFVPGTSDVVDISMRASFDRRATFML